LEEGRQGEVVARGARLLTAGVPAAVRCHSVQIYLTLALSFQ
jgi:hypothetical protein